MDTYKHYEKFAPAGVWSEAGVFQEQLQEVSNSSAVAVEVREAGPRCRVEDRCALSTCIEKHYSWVWTSDMPRYIDIDTTSHQ